VVQARCYEAERSLFLQPVAEAVRAAALALPPDRLAAAALEAAGTLAELVPELRRLLDLPGYERARPSWSGGSRSRRSPPSCAAWPPSSRCC